MLSHSNPSPIKQNLLHTRLIPYDRAGKLSDRVQYVPRCDTESRDGVTAGANKAAAHIPGAL